VALLVAVRTASRVLGRREWRGLEMLPVRGLRDVGAPAWHAGGGGGVCSTGRSSAAMGLRPGWSRDRGELRGDGCVVELEGRRGWGSTPESSLG
jgi:hypothetical protein